MTKPVRSFIAVSAALVALAQAPGALAESPKAFIKKAMEGDNAEVQMGKLAQQKGGSQNVRDFGQMLEMDHGAHKQKAAELASTLGVKQTDESPLMAKMELHKLEGLSGAKFDHAFAVAMVKDHKKDIGEYSKQAKTKGPAAEFARDTLPTLNKHLATAERLANAH